MTTLGMAVVAGSAAAQGSPTGCPVSAGLVNPSFEAPGVNRVGFFNQAAVPGWSTTATDGRIELWRNTSPTTLLDGGPPAPAGIQVAELNAFQNAALFQDVATVPGTQMVWRLQHRARGPDPAAVDVMRVLIGPPGGPFQQSGPDLADGPTAWVTHLGSYTVPAGQTATRVLFDVVSSPGPGFGNLLDDVSFATDACLITAKSVADVNGGDVEIGDVLAYEISSTNQGTVSLLDTVLSDAVPAGTMFVPGSLVVDGTAQTDAAGDDQAEHTAGTVVMRLGAGSTATSGGTVAPAATVTASFQVTVTTTDAAQTVVNAAAITGTSQSGATVTSTSNDATVTTASADLVVAKEQTTDPLLADGPVQWTITVTNDGPSIARNVTVSDTLPAGISGAIGQVDGGAACTGTTPMTCDLGDVVAGDRRDIIIDATVDADQGGSTLLNTATAASTTGDPTPGDAEATTSSNVPNDPPVPQPDAETTMAGTPVTIDVVGNDIDPNGEPLIVRSVTQPTNGTAVLNDDGTITYTPNPGFVGTDTFTYAVCDTNSPPACATETVTVTVTAAQIPTTAPPPTTTLPTTTPPTTPPPATAPPTPEIPATGQGTALPLAAGLLLVILGAAIVTSQGRRPVRSKSR